MVFAAPFTPQTSAVQHYGIRFCGSLIKDGSTGIKQHGGGGLGEAGPHSGGKAGRFASDLISSGSNLRQLNIFRFVDNISHCLSLNAAATRCAMYRK